MAHDDDDLAGTDPSTLWVGDDLPDPELDGDWDGTTMLPPDDGLGADVTDDTEEDASLALVTSWRKAQPTQRDALMQDTDFLQWLKNKGFRQQAAVTESAPPDANGRLGRRAAQIARLLYP